MHTMIIDVLRMSSAMATMAELLRGERRERGTEEEGGGEREAGRDDVGKGSGVLEERGKERRRRESIATGVDIAFLLLLIVGLIYLQSSLCPRDNRSMHTFSSGTWV